MGLHHLVSLKQALKENFAIDASVAAIEQLRDQIEQTKTQAPEVTAEDCDYIDGVVAHYNQLIDAVQAPLVANQLKIQQLDQEINNLVHTLYAENYRMEERDGIHSMEFVRDHRRLALQEDTEQAIKQRILLHTNWRYPSLEIGCREGEWTQFLVAADPLYLIDKYPEFLESANNQFPAQYQARLRKYLLKNYDLSALPQAQFAFVFSWGFFNYLSLDTITQMLKQTFQLLRPGGVMLFSYNDGDTVAGAGMSENNVQTFIPKSILVPTCQSLGFEVVHTENAQVNINWIEIQRPGVLHTVKAHQVLGEIKRREDTEIN